jgi:hypothetical protein
MPERLMRHDAACRTKPPGICNTETFHKIHFEEINMKRTCIAATIGMALALATGMASAAGDPWVGTWHRQGPNGAPDITLTVTPAPGGYTFARKQSDTPVEMSVPVIPDGHPHAAKGALGPLTATCRHADARTLTCKLSMAGLENELSYALSADGKSLTDSESDPELPGKPSSYTEHIVLQKQ